MKTRRDFIKTAAATTAFVSGCKTTGPHARRPNIMLFITDQQRADTLSILNETICRTPNIDRLAKTGITYRRCITPSPLCTPARASIFTGRYPQQLKGKPDGDMPEGLFRGPTMMSNKNILQGNRHFVDELKKAGYYLDYTGKWHIGKPLLKTWFDRHESNHIAEWPEGIESWAFFSDDRVTTKSVPRMSTPTAVRDDLPLERSLDAWIADTGIRHIKELPHDRPWFMTCSFIGPHPPFKLPDPYFSMYNPDSIKKPKNLRPNRIEEASNPRNYFRKIYQEHGITWDAWKKSYAAYYGFTTLVDAQIGRVLKALEETGQDQNTLFVFCSDHGELLGAHGLWMKFEPYEEAVRVPLVFSAPWIRQNVIVDQPVSLTDIVPTILNEIGLNVPSICEGEALNLKNPSEENRFVFSGHIPLGEFHNTSEWRMITDRHWKYVWNEGELGELFNLTDDPGEQHNLILDPAYASKSRELQQELIQFMTRIDDPVKSLIKRECNQS